VKVARNRHRRMESRGRKRITELQGEAREGFLTALDGRTLYGPGLKRSIFTGIDVHSKIALARRYATKGSRHGEDFLQRLYDLLAGKIENVHTDHGSEFKKDFEEGCRSLKIPHYDSRPHTPQDNPFNERLNRPAKAGSRNGTLEL
jgi:transposase InsO family protein